MNAPTSAPPVVIIGAGPAGLMAAESLLAKGLPVLLCDAMPSVGRKFLLAGIGGLNLTHAEPREPFLSRYAEARERLQPLIDAFDPAAQRDWVHGLGIETFVGSSGRVFPREMKAAPLLRRWLQRLRMAGLQLQVRTRWTGWQPGDAPTTVRLAGPAGERVVEAAAVILALGGGSWARLGSDGRWLPWLAERGVAVSPLRPANCGFEADWSPVLAARGGSPLKGVTLQLPWTALPARKGECLLTAQGLEGSLVYALSAPIRDRIAACGEAVVHLGLLPDRPRERLQRDLARPRGKLSLSRHLQRAGLDPLRIALLREILPAEVLSDPQRLADAMQALPVTLRRARPLDEAISSAGGVCWQALDPDLMLSALPGVFCAGEMIDWEAPTGGYLLTACLATGRAAGQAAAAFVGSRFTLV